MYSRLNDSNRGDDESSATQEDRTEMSEFLPATPSSGTGSYGSTSLQDDDSVSDFYIPWCGLLFYAMAFLGFACALVLRESLSVAIVAMVNQTAVADEYSVHVTNDSKDQCPRDPELKYEDGEFVWDRNQQGIVLAAFYYGYGFTQASGGWLADRFGGKWLFGGSVLLSSVIALLTPAAARTHIVLLIIIRVVSGLGEGVMRPACHALIARWSAPNYRSIVVSVIFVGVDVGVLVGMFLSGLLCDRAGWPSAFFVFGVVGCVWSLVWSVLCYNSPSSHPRISTVERRYWETVIGTTDLVARPPTTPWREIFTSVPVWALAVAFFANNWGYYTLATCLPLFMHDVLGFAMARNGVFSAIPFIGSFVVLLVSGLLADWLRFPGRLSTNVVRKSFCAVGLGITGAFLILTGYISCDRGVVVAAMFVAAAGSAVAFICAGVNQLDLAPLHAGKIMGLTYSVASIALVGAPHAAGVLTSRQSTRSQWQNVFYLAAAIQFVGAVVFVLFGSGKRQRWADDTALHDDPSDSTPDRNK